MCKAHSASEAGEGFQDPLHSHCEWLDLQTQALTSVAGKQVRGEVSVLCAPQPRREVTGDHPLTLGVLCVPTWRLG